jgi:hypothetical protein
VRNLLPYDQGRSCIGPWVNRPFGPERALKTLRYRSFARHQWNPIQSALTAFGRVFASGSTHKRVIWVTETEPVSA